MYLLYKLRFLAVINSVKKLFVLWLIKNVISLNINWFKYKNINKFII